MPIKRLLSWFRKTTGKLNLEELDGDIQVIKNSHSILRIRKFTKLILVGFLIGKNSERKSAELKSKIQNEISIETSKIDAHADEVANSGTYLISHEKTELLDRIATLEKALERCEGDKVISFGLIENTRGKLGQISRFIASYNKDFIRQRKIDYKHLWFKGSISLDDEQQTAIVTDDKYNLVVAAAGSGKTEVLTTRIAYLIQRKPDGAEPKRILAVAFQRKAKEQIEQRLWQRYKIENVNARTFHSLGKEILERSGLRIDRDGIVNDNKKYFFIKSYIEDKVSTNPEFYKLFIRYIKTINAEEELVTEADKRESASYAKEQRYTAINHTRVNSIAEKEMMDYLLTHKINGKPLEVQYEKDIGGFRPDFYLPQIDVFIEHWGVDKEGNAPPFFRSSEKYGTIMEKKRKWFTDNEKLLVETYSYEFNPDEPERFCEMLRQRIEETVKKPLIFTPFTYEEILELVWHSQKSPVEDIQNFITVAKTYGFGPEAIQQRLVSGKWTTKQQSFGRLALEVFKAYQEQLDKLGKIDFEDMINKAISALDNNPALCMDIYDHILVDEYQDISEQRLKLLTKLLSRNPNCKLFCVGDDWQSIMGFSGSNLNFFVDFRGYFENPAITRICTNYRSVRSIVDTGAELINRNGSKQVQKAPRAKNQETRPIRVLSSPHKDGYDKQYYEQIADDCLSKISEYLDKGYSPEDILVLTRFIRTKIFGRYRWFRAVQSFQSSAQARDIKVAIDNAKLPNAVKLLTVHKCKGLEARVVFILDVVSGDFGFPSEIEDASILMPARGDNGIQDHLEEERRLFYVAITRAKENLYIYTRSSNRSRFLDEIASHTECVRISY